MDLGLEQGKNIYAVPGRITDKLSAGCNNLIKMGAKPVTSPQDILEDFPGYDSIMQKVSSQPDQIKLTGLLSSEEQAVYDIIDLSPKHIEELICLTGFEMGKLMEYLLSLELKDLIYQPVKNRYTRNVKLFT